MSNLKIIYGVIAGFVLWSLLWLGTDIFLRIISPEWYGEGTNNFHAGALLVSLVRSVVISLISGFFAAFVARDNKFTTTAILGILLQSFGIFVQGQHWNQIPLWYHFIFLASLIPLTILGGKLQRL